MIKGIPWISQLLAVEKASKSNAEEFRKAFVQLLAISAGALLTWSMENQLPKGVDHKWYVYLIFGAMASGGSGLWNSVLDIVREANKQKQLATDRLKPQ